MNTINPQKGSLLPLLSSFVFFLASWSILDFELVLQEEGDCGAGRVGDVGRGG